MTIKKQQPRNCRECGTKFIARIRNDRDPQQFCSQQCWGQYRMKESRKRVPQLIELYVHQGMSSHQIAQQTGMHASLILRFLNEAGVETRDAGAYVKKAIRIKSGYRVVDAHGHPRAFDDHKVYEHTLVAERLIGRYLLKDEFVHHVDLDKQNNSENNLIVLNASEHMTHHRQLNQVVSELIKDGIIYYDRTTKTYKRS
jgi:DNA-binding transcriptional regulator LsrR (DeoR family)